MGRKPKNKPPQRGRQKRPPLKQRFLAAPCKTEEGDLGHYDLLISNRGAWEAATVKLTWTLQRHMRGLNTVGEAIAWLRLQPPEILGEVDAPDFIQGICEGFAATEIDYLNDREKRLVAKYKRQHQLGRDTDFSEADWLEMYISTLLELEEKPHD